jgi:hypothetical protein
MVPGSCWLVCSFVVLDISNEPSSRSAEVGGDQWAGTEYWLKDLVDLKYSCACA